MADVLNKITTKLEVDAKDISSTVSRLEEQVKTLYLTVQRLDTLTRTMTKSAGRVTSAIKAQKATLKGISGTYDTASGAARKYEASINAIKNATNRAKTADQKYMEAMANGSKKSWSTWKQAPAGSAWRAQMEASMKSVKKPAGISGKVAQGAFMGGLTAGLVAMVAQVAIRIVKALGAAIKQGVLDMNSYIEQTNLFFVSLTEKYAKTADTYVNKLSKSLGINDGVLRELQGKLYMIGSSFGIADNQAYRLSEQVTKLTMDFASFYNQDYKTVQDNMIAGLVGQSRAMRKYGITVNEAAIAEVARRQGYTGSIRMLSEASKVQLRYIAMMEQSKRQMNDLERTIETPANAMRVWKSQTEVLSRTLGSIFMPMLQALMPVLMAITNVITNLLKSVAAVMGFEMPDVEFAGAKYDVEDMSEDSEEFADNMGSAAGSAAKISKYFSGMDELNVMNDTKAGAGGGAGASPGYNIDFDIGDSGYDQLLLDVKAKWQELSDAIENSWFVKDFLPALGRVFKGVYDIFVTILAPVFKGFLDGMKKFEWLLKPISDAFNILADGLEWVAEKLGGANKLFEKLGEILSLVVIYGIYLFFAPLVALIHLIKMVTDVAIDWGNKTKEVIDGVKAWWEELKRKMDEKLWAMADGIREFISNVIQKFNEMKDGVRNAIQFAVDWGVEKWNSFVGAIRNVMETVKQVFSNAWNSIKETIKGVWDSVLNIFSKGGKIFDGIVGAVSDTFKTIVNSLIGGINKIIAVPFNAINKMLNSIRDASFLGIQPFKNMWGYNPLYVPKIPQLARGGMVSAGQAFIAGEAGKELVGSHRGKTTVMPLENTGFVQAMYDAVKGAVISGMSSVEGANGDVYVTLDGTIVGRASMKQQNAYARRTGGR